MRKKRNKNVVFLSCSDAKRRLLEANAATERAWREQLSAWPSRLCAARATGRVALEDAGARRCCSRQGRQGGRSVGLARPGALRLRRTRGLHGTRPPGAQGVTGAPRSHVLPWGVALLLPAQARKALLFVGDPPFPRGQHVVERVSTDARPGKRGAAGQGRAGRPPGCVDTEGADARADRDPGCRGAAPRTRLGRTPAAQADGSPRPGCGARLLSTADRLGDLLVPSSYALNTYS